MCWYTSSAKGKVRERPTVSSSVNHAGTDFATFTEATETQT
jgi:hypothetical protein